MNLDKRISELEQRAGGGADAVSCIFLVAMEGEKDGQREDRQPVGYSACGRFGEKRWDIGEGQTAEKVRAQIAREVRAAGPGVVALVAEHYAEEVTA